MALQRPGNVKGRAPSGHANRHANPGCHEPITLILGQAPRSGFFPFFPLWFRLSVVRLWQRVLSSLPFAGAPTGLHQTLLEVLSSR